MRYSNTISFGFLVCLISLYFMNDAFGGFGVTLGGYLFPVGAVIVIVGILRSDSDSDRNTTDEKTDDNVFWK